MINYYKNFNLNYISSFLLIIFPISLVAGSFIAEISMNSLSLIFLYKIFRNKNFNIFKKNFFLIFIIFYVIILVSVIFSNYIEAIFFKNFFILDIFYLLLLLCIFLKRTINCTYLFTKCYVLFF